MKCMIPAQNVKIFARALHSLSRVGDELYVDPLINGLALCAVNSSQSAFAEFIFLQSYFSSYSISKECLEALPKCKISMRSCLSVFKSPHSMDKMVDWCQLRLEPDSVQFIFQVKFSGGSMKTYFLPIIECESLQVKYKKSDSIRLEATSKLLSGIVKNFRLNEDEITVSVTKQKATIRNHIDSSSEKNETVRTEMALLAGEFEIYSVNECISVTFCLKQLRAVLAFAEPGELPITIFLEAPGRPVIFSVSNESLYEVNFVVSSLQSANSQSQGTQKSDLFINSKQQKEHQVNCNTRPNENPNVENVLNCSKNAHIVSNNLGINVDANNGTSDGQTISRKRPRDSDEPSNSANTCLNTNQKVINAIGNSIQDTLLIGSNDMDVLDNIPSSPQNSPKPLVNNVFSRCFNSTFQRNLLPGFSNVIAYDSDGLEDSD